MRFTDALRDISRSALVTSSQRVTQSTESQKEHLSPKKESKQYSRKTSMSPYENVVCYTDSGGLVFQMKSKRSWST